MFASPLCLVSPHLSPYHPYSSPHHVTSPISAKFHTPRSPSLLDISNLPKRSPVPSLTKKRCFEGESTGDIIPDRCPPLIRRAISQGSPFKRSRIETSGSSLVPFIASPLKGITPSPPADHLYSVPTTSTASSSSLVDPLDISSIHTVKMDSAATTSSVSTNQQHEYQMPPSRHTASPPSLAPRLCMKRSNPKRLSLTLTMPVSAPATPIESPSEVTPTYCPTNASTESTPFTPGSPKTPALVTASLGRTTTKGMRRPSLLSLITQPTTIDDVPPTPGGSVPYFQGRPPLRLRARSSTTGEVTGSERDYRATYPSRSFPPISEHGGTPAFGMSFQSTSSSPSESGTSASASTSTTPSSSPPLPQSLRLAPHLRTRASEPYQDGPVEIIPNVFLGAEISACDLTWARQFKSVRIINVAQEIENPFDVKGKGREKIAFGNYTEDGLEVEYCHLRWSHGEGGLADVPEDVKLQEVLNGQRADMDAESWGFWNAIKWLEEARRDHRPVLIHCQCGISRSATLVVAYLMCLAVSGLASEHLGHLKGMQDTYDLVKQKSSCIGPNVSLVFQLVEFQRTLTALLSEYAADPSNLPIKTSFPTLAEQTMSEAEWARRRAEFENEADSEEGCAHILPSPLSPEEAGIEARQLDEAMLARLKTRE